MSVGYCIRGWLWAFLAWLNEPIRGANESVEDAAAREQRRRKRELLRDVNNVIEWRRPRG